MSRKLYGVCNKCQTKQSVLFEYNGQLLCKANECLNEEIEKQDSKIDTDLQNLEDYRALCAGTENISPSSY